MAVDIDVNLNKIDTRDIAKVEAQLAKIGDGIDLDFDIEDLVSGDFDEIQIDIDEDRLKSQMQRAMQKVNADMESGIFDPFAGGGEGERGVTTRSKQLGQVIKELQTINRKLTAQSLGSGVTVNEKLPDFTDRDTVDYRDITHSMSGQTIQVTSSLDKVPDDFMSDWGMDDSDLLGFLNSPRQHKFTGQRLSDILGAGGGATPGMARNVQSLNSVPDGGYNQRARQAVNTVSRTGGLPDIDKKGVKISKIKKNLKSLNAVGSGLTKMFNKLRPSMGSIYAVVITLLPLIIGLASGIAAVAVAGASLLAVGGIIGLLGAMGGEADSLSGSMKQAQERMQDFKQALFQAVEPVADIFGPVVDRFLDAIVNKVRGLRDELASLQGFTGIFFDGLDAAGVVIEKLLQSVIQLASLIKAVSRYFGGIISSALPEFFRNTVLEAGKLSGSLVKVLEVVWELARLLYFVSKAVLRFVAALSVLKPLINFIADVLGNKWVQSLIIIAGVLLSIVGIVFAASKALYGMLYVLYLLNAAWVANGTIMGAVASMYAGSWIASAVSGLSTMISVVWGLNGALGITAQLLTAIVGLATLGAGVALALGGVAAVQDSISPEVPSGGPGGKTVNNDVTMNFQGDMDAHNRAAMQDEARGVMYKDNLSSGEFGASR